MISPNYRHKNKSWKIGDKVTIGFLKDLEIMGYVPTPNDFKPDAYLLRDGRGTYYRFVPYYGIEKIT